MKLRYKNVTVKHETAKQAIQLEVGKSKILRNNSIRDLIVISKDEACKMLIWILVWDGKKRGS